eukprot:SM000047S16906  [mRNA]  locus=s47:658701:661877:- [translate_table: standard]
MRSGTAVPLLLAASAAAALAAAIAIGYTIGRRRALASSSETHDGETAAKPGLELSEQRLGASVSGSLPPPVVDGLLGAIGNTPLVRIRSLSDATGCQILGKCEFLNPCGSVKDRVAKQIVAEALASRQLAAGGLVVEGTSGSTGISLAAVALAYGCRCFVAMPDDAAAEKAELLVALGAEVEQVRPVSITHRDHFVNVARRRANAAAFAGSGEAGEVLPGAGFFADQFENLANFRAHYSGTGPEIWQQTSGNLDAFVASAGTGGTLAGVSCFLKDRDPAIKCYLVDPPGSGLYNRVTRGVMYTREEAEGRRMRNPFDTVIEGVGLNRLTSNFAAARLDGAFQGTDQETLDMARYLLAKDGLFLGSSSALNCVGAVRVAQLLGPGSTIVTILCDSGTRHLSKFYNDKYLADQGLAVMSQGLDFLDSKSSYRPTSKIHK